MVGHFEARATVAFAAVLLASLACDDALSQGNIGGSIGKKDKVISGDKPSAPRRAPAKVAKREKASTSSPSRASRSITGTWRWVADCERNVRHFEGTMTFDQTGSTFTATHGGTNNFDTGMVTNGRIVGDRVSFTRQWGMFVDNLDLKLSGRRMQGVLPNTQYSGRCTVTATRL